VFSNKVTKTAVEAKHKYRIPILVQIDAVSTEINAKISSKVITVSA